MRVNLKQLGLLSGQKTTVREKVLGDPEWLKGMQAVFTEKISVELQVEHIGNYWRVQGKLKAPLKLMCSRCLEEFPYEAKGDFERIVFAAETRVQASLTEDDAYLVAEEGSADFSQAIEETLVLNLPMVPLCHEDCSGLCAVCGQNLNLGTCHCRDDVIDPRLEKLKELL